MMSAHVLTVFVFVLFGCSLLSPVNAILEEADFADWPGDRICENDEFNDSIRQIACNAMLPFSSGVAADATCQNIKITMLDEDGDQRDYTRFMLVCRYGQGGQILGCVCARGSSGTGTHALNWDGESCH